MKKIHGLKQFFGASTASLSIASPRPQVLMGLISCADGGRAQRAGLYY